MLFTDFSLSLILLWIMNSDLVSTSQALILQVQISLTHWALGLHMVLSSMYSDDFNFPKPTLILSPMFLWRYSSTSGLPIWLLPTCLLWEISGAESMEHFTEVADYIKALVHRGAVCFLSQPMLFILSTVPRKHTVVIPSALTTRQCPFSFWAFMCRKCSFP